MLSQAWVDKMMSLDLDSQDVVGPPRDEEDDKRDAWALRYIARFVEVGVPLRVALESYKSSEHEYDIDPVECADEEMSYWDDDDGPAL